MSKADADKEIEALRKDRIAFIKNHDKELKDLLRRHKDALKGPFLRADREKLLKEQKKELDDLMEKCHAGMAHRGIELVKAIWKASPFYKLKLKNRDEKKPGSR